MKINKKPLCFLVSGLLFTCHFCFANGQLDVSNSPKANVIDELADQKFSKTVKSDEINLNEDEILKLEYQKANLFIQLLNRVSELENKVDNIHQLSGSTSSDSQTAQFGTIAPKTQEGVQGSPLEKSEAIVERVQKTEVEPGLNSKLSSIEEKLSALTEKLDSLGGENRPTRPSQTQPPAVKQIVKTPSVKRQRTTFSRSGDDYYRHFISTAGVSKTVTGFHYVFLKYGTGVYAKKGDIVNMDIKEMFGDFSVLSQKDNILIRYDDGLPALMKDAFSIAKEGSVVKFAALAKDVYLNDEYPSHVTANTSLIFEIRINNIQKRH